MNSQQTPLFMTHHAPVGGWASFTFGAEGMGVSIDLEAPMVSDSADFYAGVAQNGILSAFPFLAAAHKTDDADVDVLAEGNKETPPVNRPADGIISAQGRYTELWRCVPTPFRQKTSPCGSIPRTIH